MSKVDKEEFAGLIEEVLGQLSRDKAASHLWHWRSRPGCADDPIGPSRRSHLTTLLGLLGGSALAGLTPACRDRKTATCGDDPCAGDAGSDSNTTDAAKDASPEAHCGDDPCACADDPIIDAAPVDTVPDKKADVDCADDPCNCADDPCSCGDDPCACADDPCACADDPC